MRSKHIFLFVFLLAVLVRFVLNFSIPLVPGTGGGYNIVQIRELIQEGRLAVPDMPLLFYLNVIVVKILMIFFPGADMKILIIVVSKIIDSIGLPILLFPLYRMHRDLFKHHISNGYLFAVAGFAVLSYSPLELASDAQKNSLGLVFITFFIYHFLKYIKQRSRKDLVLTLLFLLVTWLIHFGTFCVSLLFLFIGMGLYFKKKAIIVGSGIGIIAVFLVAVLDPDRAMSMLTFWKSAFSIFISPRLLYYPFGILNYMFSFLLIWYLIRVVRRHKEEMSKYQKNILLLLLIIIAVLSFPFYRFEFGRRLGLMLFIPQSIVLLMLYPYFRSRVRVFFSIAILVIVGSTLTINLIHPKPHAITSVAYTDLLQMGDIISPNDSTLIFARHGLEWWVAWEHNVHIAQPHIEVDSEMKSRYKHIYFLVQKKGENLMYPGKTSIFKKPIPPDHSVLVYDSEFFELFELQK